MKQTIQDKNRLLKEMSHNIVSIEKLIETLREFHKATVVDSEYKDFQDFSSEELVVNDLRRVVSSSNWRDFFSDSEHITIKKFLRDLEGMYETKGKLQRYIPMSSPTVHPTPSSVSLSETQVKELHQLVYSWTCNFKKYKDLLVHVQKKLEQIKFKKRFFFLLLKG